MIRSIVDPGDGIITNEDTTATDYTRNDNNKPVQPQLDPGVLHVMKEMVRIMNEQVAVMDSIPPPLENVPKNKPVQIITQPDIQDILTNDTPDLSDIISIKDEMNEVLKPNILPPSAIKKEINDVIQNTPNVLPPTNGLPPADILNDIKDLIKAGVLTPDNTNNAPPTAEETGLVFPEPTGDPVVDRRNYDDYLDIFQQIRPDLFIDKDEENEIDNESKNESDASSDIIADGDQPDFVPFVDPNGNVIIKSDPDNITTEPDEIIIPPDTLTEPDTTIKIEDDVFSDMSDKEIIPYVHPDDDYDSDDYGVPYYKPKNRRNEIYRIKRKKLATKMLAKIKAEKAKNAKKIKKIMKKNKTTILVPTNIPIKSEDPTDILANPNVSNVILPPDHDGDIYNNDDVDFNISDSQIVWDDDNTDLVSLEFDTDKVIMTDDGDVILIEPDNMQEEDK